MDFLKELNTFSIYGPNHTEHISSYRYKYALPFEKVSDPKDWTVNVFQKYWYHSITISVVYFALIKVIQSFMESRKPFQLKTPLFLWNAALAIFSICGFVRFSEDIIMELSQNGLYKSLCFSCHPNDVAAFWSLLFAISKCSSCTPFLKDSLCISLFTLSLAIFTIVELGDTLFIVLRKKPLIFLHYYHHAAVLIYTIHSGAEHTAAGRAFISMNYFAHSCMYTYYAVAAWGIRLPKWISICVTTIQTVQMLGGVGVSYMVYKIKTESNMPCQQSMSNLYLAFIIYVTFAVLFFNFFYRTYIQKSKKQQKTKKSE